MDIDINVGGPLKRDIDTGTDVDVDLDIDSDMAFNWRAVCKLMYGSICMYAHICICIYIYMHPPPTRTPLRVCLHCKCQ